MGHCECLSNIAPIKVLHHWFFLSHARPQFSKLFVVWFGPFSLKIKHGVENVLQCAQLIGLVRYCSSRGPWAPGTNERWYPCYWWNFSIHHLLRKKPSVNRELPDEKVDRRWKDSNTYSASLNTTTLFAWPLLDIETSNFAWVGPLASSLRHVHLSTFGRTTTCTRNGSTPSEFGSEHFWGKCLVGK